MAKLDQSDPRGLMTPERERTRIRRKDLTEDSPATKLMRELPDLTPAKTAPRRPISSYYTPRKILSPSASLSFSPPGFPPIGERTSDWPRSPRRRKEIQEQREAIRRRNPRAFEDKFTKSDATAGKAAQHMRGCNCKKSHCQRRYCECYEVKLFPQPRLHCFRLHLPPNP
ncbi:hypothetical protein WJX84_010579 [Apatococcus fuscideae]|uniref:CRC domain-containing protein n=1 Tax=Apatococcus fuscideae TaxID=2026836 RepID=A0AAW1SNX8_9CHLO